MNDTERDTILAALRTWQNHIANVEDTDSDLWKIATDDGEHAAMTHEEINELCERLNVTAETTGGMGVIIIGNLNDGFKFVGPFDSWDAASEYDGEAGHEHNPLTQQTWIITLEQVPA